MKLTYPEWVDYETKSKTHSRGWGNYQHGYHHTYQPAYKNNGNYNRVKDIFKNKIQNIYGRCSPFNNLLFAKLTEVLIRILIH